LGSPRSPARGSFPNPNADCSRSAVCSPSVTIASSSFRDASPLQSSFALSPRSGPFGRRPLSSTATELHLLRFSSLFATSHARSHFSRDFPSLTTFRPQAFAASRRLAPRTCLRACFIPQPRPGFDLFRGFSPARSHPSSSEGACPLAVVSSSLHAPASTFAETNALPRAMPLGFEAFICARPRSASPVIHLARARSPPQFRLLQVSCRSRRRHRFPRPPSARAVRDARSVRAPSVLRRSGLEKIPPTWRRPTLVKAPFTGGRYDLRLAFAFQRTRFSNNDLPVVTTSSGISSRDAAAPRLRSLRIPVTDSVHLRLTPPSSALRSSVDARNPFANTFRCPRLGYSPSLVQLQRIVIERAWPTSSPNRPTCSSFRAFHPKRSPAFSRRRSRARSLRIEPFGPPRCFEPSEAVRFREPRRRHPPLSRRASTAAATHRAFWARCSAPSSLAHRSHSEPFGSVASR